MGFLSLNEDGLLDYLTTFLLAQKPHPNPSPTERGFLIRETSSLSQKEKGLGDEVFTRWAKTPLFFLLACLWY